MPILVTEDWTWEQTDDEVTVTVPVPHCTARNTDILTTDVFVKISSPPYLFLLDTMHEIDPDKAEAVISPGKVLLRLPKAAPGPWDDVKFSPAGEDKAAMRAELLARRAEGERRAQEREAAVREALKKKKEDDARAVRDRLWEIERAERKAIEDAKAKEKEEAEADLYKWKAEQERADRDVEKREAAARRKAEAAKADDEAAARAVAKAAPPPPEAAPARAVVEEVASSEDEYEVVEEEDEPIFEEEDVARAEPPPVRQRREPVRVKFTDLSEAHAALGLPARNKEPVLADKPNGPAKLETGKDVSETNAAWLKDKGDAFFKQGNHSAAMNAYTAAISIDPAMRPALANRGLCALKMGKWDEAVADMSTCIDMLAKPDDLAAVDADPNREPRARMLARRSAAHLGRGDADKARADMESALHLDPQNAKFRADLNAIVHSQ